jgi:hypothetical protein
MMTKINNKVAVGVLSFLLPLSSLVFTSCEDFFEQESDHVMFVGDDRLNNATDTIYSVTGIMRKLQSVAERTILLGEARADLVDVTTATSADLRNVALFDINDDNRYNNPRDYYAVINNCNYFLANVDLSVSNSRKDEVFKREYAVVKAYRAWAYMQLGILYGKVPFFTDPILTKEQAESYEKGHDQDWRTIFDWLIKDLTPLANDQYLKDFGETPLYGDIAYKVNSRLYYFPIKVLLGELNLWLGNYRQAAEWYYKYISTRNGENSSYTTGTASVNWTSSKWLGVRSSYSSQVNDESYTKASELITMIPGDSIPYNGNYLQLRNIFNTTDPITGEYHEASLTPSKGLAEISEAQTYCYYENTDTTLTPKENISWADHLIGDLRLFANVTTGPTVYHNQRVTYQRVEKHQTRNAHLWRRQMVWLHFAEALNGAGYPRFAYQILARGLSNKTIRNYVIPYYRADSVWIKGFDFDDDKYISLTPLNTGTDANKQMQGIHSRGCGWTGLNKAYPMPYNVDITDSLSQIAYQQNAVDCLIADECALEFMFEGVRFYDLMRMAIHRNQPSFLADRVYARRGKINVDAVKAEIKKDLTNPDNWYLNWNGKIGIGK